MIEYVLSGGFRGCPPRRGGSGRPGQTMLDWILRSAQDDAEEMVSG